MMSTNHTILNNQIKYSKIIARLQRNGIIIDTCALLLLLVGQRDVKDLENKSRLEGYTDEHFYALCSIIKYAKNKHSTVYVLPEISNLIINRNKNGVQSERQFEYTNNLLKYFQNANTLISYKEIAEIFGHISFSNLGITDTSILIDALENNRVVITDDYGLYSQMHSFGGPCLLVDELPIFCEVLMGVAR